jgi:ribonucleoside-diphosphate reductase alpha chain
MALASEHTGIGIRRYFTTPGVDPYDEMTWERRAARISNWKTGEVAFEQLGVEVPSTWSVNATNILAQKYFRGTLGTPERETSLRQVADRVVDTITGWGVAGGYFATAEEAETFRAELKHLIIHQKAAFNSPVWFNIGVRGVPQQASACFILAVEDTMDSILNWYVEEGIIFKGGSGAGVNLSKIRASSERLKGGGTASGPVSFMRGADASAGTIKSGGKTRRAAKMVMLDVDHPDITEFIWCKAIEERKARVLRSAGFDMDLDGADSHSIQYQNANNSVRVSDEFMQAVVDDGDWDLIARTTGEVVRTVKARDLMRQFAQAAWECADPGMQFDTTINRWHTAANTGRINGSNPCFTGDTWVHTDRGLVQFADLMDRVRLGEVFGVYTHDATNPDAPAERLEITTPKAVMVTGRNEIVRLRFSNGAELRCTAGHRIWTTNRGYVTAGELTPEDRVKLLTLPAPPVAAERRLPVSTDVRDYAGRDRRTWQGLALPEKWSPELAHYLGWLVGDGCLSGDVATTVYGSDDDRAHVLARHAALLAEWNGGRSPKASVQANGTLQLRQSRSAVTRFLSALGLSDAPAHRKVVPWSINEAPGDAVAAFLQGLFDADGCVVDNDKNRYVGLGSASEELLRGVQRLLATFGIFSRIRPTKAATEDAFTHVRSDGTFAIYDARPQFDLRITARSLAAFAQHIGFSVPAKAAKLSAAIGDHVRYATDEDVSVVERTDDGVELTYNLSEPRNHSYIANGVVVRNCSEYMHLDNSACNLASLNLLRFLGDDDTFDVEGFKSAVEVVFTAQEILVGRADYPTEAIAENSRRFRQLGLGYANIGALLMNLGLPYDSDEGRALAASITALMTGHAYYTSACTAARMGPFAGYADNAEHMLRVLEMHRAATAEIDEELADTAILSAAQQAWDNACELAAEVGVRNSQATVLAPTGTIGLLMDCDTTGIEPDLGLCKMKKLVGGGTMLIVNQSVPRALRRLGYTESQVEAIVAHIDDHKTILGAPGLDPAHVAVFACSMGDNPIHYLGHVKMMAAVQPFISGAISKTVNMPEDVTVEDVEQLHIDAWKMGVKAIAIYRDNCKVAQPLSMAKKGDGAAAATPADRVVEVVEKVVYKPVRERLPRNRRSRTFEFRVADCKGFVTVGEYTDGRPGEVFLRVSKQGSTLAGIMDALAISLSHGLQYGVPLRTFVETFTGMRFEPAGMTDDPDIRIATSIMDYLFRKLAVEYLSYQERAELGIFTTGERTQQTLPGVEETATPTVQGPDVPADPVSVESADEFAAKLAMSEAVADPHAPICMQCGIGMVRSGSCHACPSCGTTSGCS